MLTLNFGKSLRNKQPTDVPKPTWRNAQIDETERIFAADPDRERVRLFFGQEVISDLIPRIKTAGGLGPPHGQPQIQTGLDDAERRTIVLYDPEEWSQAPPPGRAAQRRWPPFHGYAGDLNHEEQDQFHPYESSRFCSRVLWPTGTANPAYLRRFMGQFRGAPLPDDVGEELRGIRLLVVGAHFPRKNVQNVVLRQGYLRLLFRKLCCYANEHDVFAVVGGDFNLDVARVREVWGDLDEEQKIMVQVLFPSELVGVRKDQHNIDGFVLVTPLRSVDANFAGRFRAVGAARMLAHLQYQIANGPAAPLFDHEPVFLQYRLEAHRVWMLEQQQQQQQQQQALAARLAALEQAAAAAASGPAGVGARVGAAPVPAPAPGRLLNRARADEAAGHRAATGPAVAQMPDGGQPPVPRSEGVFAAAGRLLAARPVLTPPAVLHATPAVEQPTTAFSPAVAQVHAPRPASAMRPAATPSLLEAQRPATLPATAATPAPAPNHTAQPAAAPGAAAEQPAVSRSPSAAAASTGGQLAPSAGIKRAAPRNDDDGAGPSQPRPAKKPKEPTGLDDPKKELPVGELEKLVSAVRAEVVRHPRQLGNSHIGTTPCDCTDCLKATADGIQVLSCTTYSYVLGYLTGDGLFDPANVRQITEWQDRHSAHGGPKWFGKARAALPAVDRDWDFFAYMYETMGLTKEDRVGCYVHNDPDSGANTHVYVIPERFASRGLLAQLERSFVLHDKMLLEPSTTAGARPKPMKWGTRRLRLLAGKVGDVDPGVDQNRIETPYLPGKFHYQPPPNSGYPENGCLYFEFFSEKRSESKKKKAQARAEAQAASETQAQALRAQAQAQAQAQDSSSSSSSEDSSSSSSSSSSDGEAPGDDCAGPSGSAHPTTGAVGGDRA